MLYVREDMSRKILKEYTPEIAIENFFVEINLRLRKWLPSCSQKQKINLIAVYLHFIGTGIDFNSSKYANFVVLGDLNKEVFNSFIEQFYFYALYNVKSLIKDSAYFKKLIIRLAQT